MQRYDDRLELAPRDVVSHAIILESRRQGSQEFYLDISHKDPDFLRHRFPMIYENLLKQGYDLTRDRIPIFPCQHYLMGGIDVNADSRTGLDRLIPHLFSSHTGVHGSNRLASNSLLEALVFSRHAAMDIAKHMQEVPADFEEYTFVHDPDAPPIPQGLRTEIRHIMQHSYFVIPDKEAAAKGFARVARIRQMLLEGNYRINADYIEAKSLATVAYLILKEVI